MSGGVASAQTIGIDFDVGDASGQAPGSTAVAGPVPTSGWNNNVDLNNPPTAYVPYNPYNPSDTGTPLALVDNTGATTTGTFGFNNYGFATLNGGSTYSPGYGATGGANSGYTPDQQLYNGAAYAAYGCYVQQITLGNIPYAQFDVYVLATAYASVSGDFGEGSVQLFSGSVSVTAGPTYYLGSYAQAGAVPSSYVQATSTDQQNPTMGADYVLFSGLTGGNGTTYSFDLSASGNASSSFNSYGAFISAVEIVQISTNSSGSAPVITSATTASGTVGSAFSYQITASNNPTSYDATGLPAGLSVNTNSGVISGTPVTLGTNSVTISAFNQYGTGSNTLSLTVNSGDNALAAPTGLTASGGASSVTLNWSSSSGATSYEIYRGTSSGGETLLVSGITTTTYTDTNVTNGTTYYYKVVAVNGSGLSSYSNEANDFPNSSGGTGDINLAGYTLTFDDEFNTLSLSSSSSKGSENWYGYPADGGPGWFSESAWNPNAFSVSDGVLSVLCWSNSTKINGQNWQSGIMCSVDTTGAGFSQQYGYFEIRCEVPNAGDGAWPAFWLDTTSGVTEGANEEIDILEWYGICDTPGSYQAIMQEASHNWNANGSQNQSAPYLYSPQTPMPYGAYPWQGYHIYGCSITASNITWYIDGVQENQIATPPAAYMNSPFYVMVDYTIGGGWPVSGTPFNTGGSSSLLVDWVRVYSQLTQAAPPTLAATLSGGTVLLTFPAESGFQYQVEYKNTLNTAAWNLLGEPIAGSGVVETATDSAGQTNRFYRLQVQLQ